MSYILQPWQLLVVVFASWVHHEQQKVIEFYQAQLDAMMRTIMVRNRSSMNLRRKTYWPGCIAMTATLVSS